MVRGDGQKQADLWASRKPDTKHQAINQDVDADHGQETGRPLRQRFQMLHQQHGGDADSAADHRRPRRGPVHDVGQISPAAAANTTPAAKC